MNFIKTPKGLRVECIIHESRGTFTHIIEIREGFHGHLMPILRRGKSGRSSGCYVTLSLLLSYIETASSEILDLDAVVKNPEALVELIKRYDGLSAHEKVRALNIARQLPEAIKLARRKKRETKRNAA